MLIVFILLQEHKCFCSKSGISIKSNFYKIKFHCLFIWQIARQMLSKGWLVVCVCCRVLLENASWCVWSFKKQWISKVVEVCISVLNKRCLKATVWCMWLAVVLKLPLSVLYHIHPVLNDRNYTYERIFFGQIGLGFQSSSVLMDVSLL